MEDLVELMMLGSARSKLINRGCRTVVDNKETLVCLKSNFRLILLANVDVLVVVNDIRSAGEGTLDLDRIVADVESVHNYFALAGLPGGRPSPANPVMDSLGQAVLGSEEFIGHGRLIVIAYLCDEVEPRAAHRIQKVAPAQEWQSCTLVTAQDAAGLSYVLKRTPFYGAAMYPELRRWARLVTGNKKAPTTKFNKATDAPPCAVPHNGDENATKKEPSDPPPLVIATPVATSAATTTAAMGPDRWSRRKYCFVICGACTGGVCLVLILFVLLALLLPDATIECDGDHCLQDLAPCSSSSECDSACCSDFYDSNGAFKCTPLEPAGYDPDICKA